MNITRLTPVSDLPDLLTVDEAANWLGIRRGLVYKMAKAGQLASVRLGRLTRIPKTALTVLLEKAS